MFINSRDSIEWSKSVQQRLRYSLFSLQNGKFWTNFLQSQDRNQATLSEGCSNQRPVISCLILSQHTAAAWHDSTWPWRPTYRPEPSCGRTEPRRQTESFPDLHAASCLSLALCGRRPTDAQLLSKGSGRENTSYLTTKEDDSSYQYAPSSHNL